MPRKSGICQVADSACLAAFASQTLLIVVIAIVLNLFPCSASGALVTDQFVDAFANPGPTGELGGPIVSNTQTVSQSFTVGVGGNLAFVDLQVRQSGAPGVPDGPLVVSLLRTASGVPDFTKTWAVSACRL